MLEHAAAIRMDFGGCVAHSIYSSILLREERERYETEETTENRHMSQSDIMSSDIY